MQWKNYFGNNNITFLIKNCNIIRFISYKYYKPIHIEMEATKAILIVSSHLSDAQEIIIRRMMIEGNKQINFVKFVIWHCKGDLNQKIDADELWAKFIAQDTSEIYKPSCRHQILNKFLNKK